MAAAVTWAGFFDVVRLLTVSAAAFSVGLSVVIGSRMFRNPTWGWLAASFSILLLLGAFEQLARFTDQPPSWRLPLYGFAVAAALNSQWKIVRYRIKPGDEPRHEP